jgi:hypothetical protein
MRLYHSPHSFNKGTPTNKKLKDGEYTLLLYLPLIPGVSELCAEHEENSRKLVKNKENLLPCVTAKLKKVLFSHMA